MHGGRETGLFAPVVHSAGCTVPCRVRVAAAIAGSPISPLGRVEGVSGSPRLKRADSRQHDKVYVNIAINDTVYVNSC